MKAVCAGEMLTDIIVRHVDQVAFANDTKIVDEISIRSGGDANNNAVDMSVLGNDVTFLGRVSTDSFGEYLISNAEKYGIHTEHIVRTDTPQAKSLILVNPSGDRTFLQIPGTSAEFSLEDCDLDALEGKDLLQIGGTYHLPRFDGEGCRVLLAAAKERGLVTSMDVTTDRSGKWEDVLTGCYENLDYFLPSIEQAVKISRLEEPEEIAAFFLEKGVKNVAVKLGSRGSYFRNREQAFYMGCYENIPIAETTGAGDAFCAGFLTGVGKGMDPEACMTLATACSAFAIQGWGATDGMRDFDTVSRFIAERPPLPVSRDAGF